MTKCENCSQLLGEHRAADNACPLPLQLWNGRKWRGGFSDDQKFATRKELT